MQTNSTKVNPMQPQASKKKQVLVLKPFSPERLAELNRVRVRQGLPPLTNEQIREREQITRK